MTSGISSRTKLTMEKISFEKYGRKNALPAVLYLSEIMSGLSVYYSFISIPCFFSLLISVLLRFSGLFINCMSFRFGN